jgi:RNA polymerase sigma-70 factor (ECF subfamily)
MVIERLEGRIRVGPTASSRAEAERRAAFERFSQPRLERAYHLASVVLRNGNDAEDAVHDAAVRAWLHWGDLRDQQRLDAWFDRIVVNECRARLRRQAVRILPTNDSVPLGLDPFRDVLEEDRLNRALATLDADHRIAVVLRYIVDLTPAEIAARTGTREGTVKSRLHYALRRMRSVLDDAERATAGGSR